MAQSLLDQVEQVMAGPAFEGVTGRLVRVHVRIGRMTAVVPDVLRFMWAAMVDGTAIEGVALEIEEVPIRARCNGCGEEQEFVDIGFVCGRCGSTDVEITSGRELNLVSLEVES
ncbi:MAG: hydrogenase maturation nickel metallochaperone HypA [Deltaproteobacteria bacterium]|nr:hydrogenase maturation nickel metallochaperone HypA [Deltaproteobacteria bacterium]